MSTAQEQAMQAQGALRVSHKAHVAQLVADAYQMKHEPGAQKILELAKELRGKALFDLSMGSKDAFEANQATWRAWDYMVSVLEVGPKQVIPQGDGK